MDNRNQIKEVIKSFSGKDNSINIPIVYIKLLDDYTTAAFLNQLVYWSDRTKRTDGYFYKTHKEWQIEMCLSRYQVDRAINKLKKLELLEVVKKKANGAPTLHYRLDMDKLTNWICEKLTNGNERNSQMDLLETDKSLTEITTEINKHRETDETSKSFQYISNNLEIIQSPLKAQQLEEAIKDFKDNKLDIVTVATDYCKENNKGINYLIKVLENWNKDGVDTKEKAIAKVTPKQPKEDDYLARKKQELLGG
ncbi:DnaD domain protein [Staphylococcus epidermidis]|uniref:DnaD domain protein n=1 Tax=Staphylococcus epidermidis TaxID=1282 RepID=UPI001879B257|nr:DnaD domain protein [Staphylococcus epidermidis]MBE7319118.1 DnaD domain protein [Staphylococcus epidermidis]